MCGRLNLSLDPADLVDELGIAVSRHSFAERYNVPPGATVPIIVDRPEANGEIVRRLEPARWGLVPGWAGDPRLGYRAFNARAETVHTKPTYRSAFASRRCVLPVRGYYEWEAAPEGKRPWLMEAADGPLLFMAGLFEFLRLDERQIVEAGGDPAAASGWLVTATVITTAARGHLADVHDRMPVMMRCSDVRRWTAPGHDARDADRVLSALIAESDPDTVLRRRVDPAVGNARNEGPELVREVCGRARSDDLRRPHELF